MNSVKDIYVVFRQSQSRFHNRPYRIPKDIEKKFAMMNKKNYENLEKISGMFNTCYHNIDPSRYFDCGFQLYKGKFSYNKFFDEKLMRLYIIKDKNLKRDIAISKESIISSLKFVIKWIGDMRNKNLSLLLQYASMYEDNTPAPIKHYNMLKIDKYFLVWLIKEGYFKLEESMKIDIPIIVENYRELTYDLMTINEFLRDVKDKIKEV